MAAALTLTLLASTAFSIAQMRDARRQRDAAVLEKRRAAAQLEFQDLMLSSIGTGQTSMREILDQGAVLLKEEYLSDPAVATGIAISLGRGYEQLGALDRQQAMAGLAESLAVLSGSADLVVASRCQRFGALVARSLHGAAAALGDSIRSRLAGGTPDVVASCLYQLSHAELIRERFDSAAALAGLGAAVLAASGDTLGAMWVDALNGQANALENLKRRREALAIYERLAAMLDSTGRAATGTRNVIRNNIGIALSNLGEMTAAEPILRETLETARRGNPEGEVHPGILINYCRTVLFQHRFDTAALYYRRLYDIRDEPFRSDEAQGLAEVALARGKIEEAERWIGEHHRANDGKPSWATLALEGGLARLRGDLHGASVLFRQALDRMGYATGRRTYQMRAVLIRAAEAARDADDAATALEYARAAAEIARSDSLSNVHSAYVGEARLLEGAAQLGLGDTAAAAASVRAALVALRLGAGADHPRTGEAESLLRRLDSLPRVSSGNRSAVGEREHEAHQVALLLR